MSEILAQNWHFAENSDNIDSQYTALEIKQKQNSSSQVLEFEFVFFLKSVYAIGIYKILHLARNINENTYT